jgi:hypothetical protein
MVVGLQRHALAAYTPCKNQGAHLGGSWVGNRADLEACGDENNLYLDWQSNSGPSFT